MVNSGVARRSLSLRRTGDIAITVPIRLSAVAMVCSMAMFFPELNGAIASILTLISAFASESMFLPLRLRHHFKTTANLFPYSEVR